MIKILKIIAIVVLALVALIVIGRSGDAPSSADLTNTYPDLAESSSRTEDVRILCPFLRMMHRAGVVAPEVTNHSDALKTTAWEIAKGAQILGCGMLECGGVAAKVSKGQELNLDAGFPAIDLGQLHKAEGVAHDCGFTFAKGGTTVDQAVRAKTLADLKTRAGPDGQLKFNDILQSKLKICKAQGVEISEPGFVEVKLIFGYLGGVDRGHVFYDDIHRLFHAEMPQNKTEHWIRFKLFKQMPASTKTASAQ